MIIREVVLNEANRLKKAGISSAFLESQLLAAFALGITREKLILSYDETISMEAQLKIQSFVLRRLNLEPLAYIRGYKEFWSLKFRVNRNVMIPRADTEILIERCIKYIKEYSGMKRIFFADIGTGSGNIACAVAYEIPDAVVFATDISTEAAKVASANILELGFEKRVRVIVGDLFAPFKQGEFFNVIAANLPYVSSGELKYLPEEIRDYEPWIALDGGEDGLGIIRKFLCEAHKYLAGGGMIAVELEDTQVSDAIEIIEEIGMYEKFGVDVDFAGFKRVLWCIKKS